MNSQDHFNGQFKAGGLCWLCRYVYEILYVYYPLNDIESMKCRCCDCILKVPMFELQRQKGNSVRKL